MHDFNFGGYIAFHHPQVKVFADSRFDLYGDKFVIRMRGKPRPSDLVAQQALGEADELGRGRIARTPTASLPCF